MSTRAALARLLICAAGLSACAQESPTDVGGTLFPGSVRTFEVIFDPSAYLVSDTAFTNYTRAQDAGFRIIASDFQGVVDANVVAAWQLPTAITVFDTLGISRSDTLPRYFAGKLVIAVDTIRSSATGPVRVRLYRLAEDFDPGSVTWTQRIDSGTVRLPWTQAGGTRGAAVFDTVWQPGVDSLVFNVDSATMAAWADTTRPVRGAVLLTETAGSRLRLSDLLLRADAHSSINRDTTVTLTVRPSESAFIFDPPPPAVASNILFVGGTPAWRSVLRLRERLDTLTVPCPDGPAGCRLRLSETTITRASLLLQPVSPPSGFLPEDSARIGARELLAADFLPLQRAPLGPNAGRSGATIAANRFLAGQGGNPVEVAITDYLAGAAADSVARRPGPYVALVAQVEGDAFGFAAFAPAPRLRLVLTIVTELQLR
jgi:hypothetical protein